MTATMYDEELRVIIVFAVSRAKRSGAVGIWQQQVMGT